MFSDALRELDKATALKEETSKTIPADNTAGMVFLKTDLIS